MRFSKRIFILLTIIAFTSGLQAGKKKHIVSSHQEVTINFKDLEINDFVKLVSNILHKNILLQAPIPGKVDFVSTTPVYKKDLPTILQSVLGSKGYSLVDRGSFLEIVRSKDATKYNLPLVRHVGDSYMQMVTKIIPVKSVNVDFVSSKIRHLASSSSSLVSIKNTNSILITDFPKNIKTIEGIIRKIEEARGSKTVFFKLKHAKVDHAYPTILSVVKNRFNNRIETQKVTVAADKAGNNIIATGSPRNLKIVKKIIEKFDSPDARSLKQTAVIPLKNTEAKDIVKVVNQLLKAQSKTSPAGIPTVVSEPNTNSIVISGTASDIMELKNILKELDKEQMQVYVKARIIEVNQEKSSDIGFKYGLTGGEANSNGLFSMAMRMGGATVVPDIKALKIDIPKLKSGLAFGAAIDFLATNGAARVVSEPSILCLNNKESKIYVGQRQSIATSTKTKDSSIDYSTNTYSREDIGLTLKIKPRISNDGKVTLETDTTIEDVLKESSKQVGMPTTTKRQVTTKAIVKNGESVIVGGLMREGVHEGESRVPLLGDIPLIGELFTHHSDSGDNVNIVIVLTPYIIKTSEDLTELRVHLAELNELQNMFSEEFERRIKQRRYKHKKRIESQRDDEQIVLKHKDK